MAFHYLTNMPLDEALEGYLAQLRADGLKVCPSELVPVELSCGRITAKPLYAKICAPHYHACAMDGIALSARLTQGVTETTPLFLKEEQFVRVDTGDPLPPNCDAVVMIEDVVECEGGVRLYAPATPWQHVRQIGEDICVGDMLLTSFSEISPAAMGAMLASGVLNVEVFRRPVVGIVPTGDEIVKPTDHPKAGDIIEFNSTIFSAMLTKWGADVTVYPIVKDRLELIKAALKKALDECDVVLLNAGSSAGREDYSSQAIADVGKVFCHGIAIRPGKPTILGSCGAKPLIGVPGYPVSGILVLEKALHPLLDWLSGRTSEEERRVAAVLARPLTSTLKYREFVRVRLGKVGEKYAAVPLNRGAGVVSSFVKADGLLDVPQNSEGFEAGEKVSVTLLRPQREIKKALIVTGSHDPLIDEIAEIMKQRWRDGFLASSHVGSMGGIFAVKRGETHAAGIHLLDEPSGEYNLPYLKKYFPQGGVALVECVRRLQGLMVAKGNPLGITSLADMVQPSSRYVNRQKGSGTRILCDFLCARSHIDTSQIYGYDREEYTHTAVAALVASGSADAGMGIYSAAKIYDLDFLPVCTEQYDLLIPLDALETQPVQRLLEVLKSSAFKERLDAMGGYELSAPGTLRATL